MRFQFAFIAVAVLATSTAIADGTLDESKAIEKIELLGGKVKRDDTLPGRPVVMINLQGSKRFNDRYIWLLKSFTRLTKLNLNGTAITDEGLKEVGNLKALTMLGLSSTTVTDKGLNEIRNLTLLNVLFIRDTATTDVGVNALKVSLLSLKVKREEVVSPAKPIWFDAPGKYAPEVR